MKDLYDKSSIIFLLRLGIKPIEGIQRELKRMFHVWWRCTTQFTWELRIDGFLASEVFNFLLLFRHLTSEFSNFEKDDTDLYLSTYFDHIWQNLFTCREHPHWNVLLVPFEPSAFPYTGVLPSCVSDMMVICQMKERFKDNYFK